jgi:hypothetical protein
VAGEIVVSEVGGSEEGGGEGLKVRSGEMRGGDGRW